MQSLLLLLVQSFATFFVVIDPIGMAPVFAAITRGETDIYRRQMAKRGTIIATILLVLFALGGEAFLNALGIGMAAFRIAGGILLFLVALDMLFAHDTPLRRTSHTEEEEAERKRDISVFPLAIPLIAGPGALTSVVLLMGSAGSNILRQGVVLLVLLVVMAVLLFALLLTTRMMRYLGVTGVNVVTRFFGLVLAALAVQFVIDGAREAFSL
ncbi:MAG TPA: MarC family protein [Alphaproteobacteria bacterium]|jgi:multiple antibiotic resistance protein|nr:MarC family protein [Alphaproteobacteria bacterium]